jgi:metal-responsive CopG/Arc/MetJ family transcriptional regulator
MYDKVAKRINARLDAALAAKVEELCKRSGKSASAVIKAALESYYELTSAEKQSAKSVLTQTGFIASASGSRELSATYKSVLTDSLKSKT